ncbi:MAG: hypothetical protein ABSG56_00975 [Bryobacteraceae bacterium]
MRKSTGTAAGLLALLAVVLHVQTAPTGEAPPVSSTEKTHAAASTSGKDGKDGEDLIEGPWMATRDYFHAEDTGLHPAAVVSYLQELSHPAGGSISQEALSRFLGIDHASPETRKDQMWSIIVTVPDPLHTRMTLTLDGQVEAIERSLQSAQWEFAGQWMPWNDRFDGREKDIAERHRQRELQAIGESIPGILIFRSHPAEGGFPAKRLLFVLLAPETATSGIAWRPFVSALNLAAVLASPGRPIGLLAPSFSGSFSSLTALVKEWQAAHPQDAPLAHAVYSGSASSFSYADAFKQATQLEFHGGVVDTPDIYQDVFCKSLLADYNIDSHKAALLKEDETGFASAFEEKGCHVRQYVFPRDISHLRNAAQDASAIPASEAYSDPGRNLNFSIRDPDSGEDSIPTYSPVQTPLAQDAIVESIARELSERETRLVFIAASNPLDIMFLMRAIRRVTPDVRMVTDNPQILMVPLASQDPLSGTVVLSTYPMFADGELWLDQSGERMIFPDPSAQGLFNVTQLLLRDLGAFPADKLQLRGYSPLDGGSAYPGVWALSLTRTGFLPLAYYQRKWRETAALPPKGGAAPEDRGWLRKNPYLNQPRSSWAIFPPRSWRITVFCTSGACLLLSLLLVWCNVAPAARKPYWLAVTEGLGPRLMVLIAAGLSLVAEQWFLACPALFPLDRILSNPAAPLAGVAFGALVLAGLLAPLAAVAYVLFLQLSRRRNGLLEKRGPISRPRATVYSFIILAVFVYVLSAWASLCYASPANSPDGFFLRFRALDLFSGSSPATPLAILAMAFFVVAVFYFKRYTAGGPNRPGFEFGLNKQESGPAAEFQTKLQTAMQGIEHCVMAPAELAGTAAMRRTGVGLLGLTIFLVVLSRYPLAFEPNLYNVTLEILLSFVLFWVSIGCYDLVLLWRRVRGMLDLLELLRLQAALKRVSRDWPRRPVWAFRQSVSKHLLNRQMIYALHGRVVSETPPDKPTAELTMAATAGVSQQQGAQGGGIISAPPALTPAQKDVADFLKVTYATAEDSKGGGDLRAILRGQELPGAAHEMTRIYKCQTASKEIASRILQSDLRPFWRESLEQEEAQDTEMGEEKKKTTYLHCCEDFVALQCCRYVAHNVEHVQRIASCISLTFLLLLVFFNSYSPEGPQAVARTLAVLFVMVGYLIVRVLASMERNATLSIISRTKPGELNSEFWVQLLTLGGLPLLGVLAHLFPSLSQFLFRWIAPGVQAVH